METVNGERTDGERTERRTDVAAASPDTTLLRLFTAAAAGSPPPSDGRVVIDSRPVGPAAGVLAFTAHHIIAADVPTDWVAELLPEGDLAAPLGPAFLLALAARLHAPIGAHDLVLAAPASDEPLPMRLQRVDTRNHPRLRRARRYRDEVRAWRTPGGEGLLILGRGLASRTEVSFEVAPDARGRGLGRALATAARHLAPAGQPVFAQIAAGNVASLHAVLAADYSPIGAEVLLPLR